MEDLKGALESLQKALQLSRELSTGDHPDIADIVNDIALVYFTMGDYHSAREQFQDALGLSKRLRDKHKSTSTGYHNLTARDAFYNDELPRSYPRLLP